MCGRYQVHTPVEDIAREFGAVATAEAAAFLPLYNVAPSLKVPVVRLRNDQRELALLSWGLVPSFSKNLSGNKPINARAETIFDTPSFRNAIRRRRCLIPADGFYEWQKVAGAKQPWHVGMVDGALFAFGGVWEYWAKPGEAPVLSCAIIVTDANEQLERIHDRMPVIIAPQDYERWLDPELSDAEITELMVPYPADEMRAYPVSTRVSNARNEGPELIEPLNASVKRE
jgi:putative SOS response-associated peptidase YedK